MSTSYILSIVQEMANEYYPKPTTYRMKKSYFIYDSYSRWAIKELIDYILSNSDRYVLDVVEEFRNKMDDYASYAKSGDANFMFSVAYDVATVVLDTLITAMQ